MKKLFTNIGTWLAGMAAAAFLVFVGVAGYTQYVNAQATIQPGGFSLFKLSGSAILPAVSSWSLGSATQRISNIYATTVDAVTLNVSAFAQGMVNASSASIGTLTWLVS